MSQRNEFDDIVISYPEAYDVVEGNVASSTSRTRSASDTLLEPDSLFVDVLADEHNLLVEKTFSLTRTRDFKKRSAGASPEDTKVKVTVPSAPDEHVVVLVEEDGLYRWEFPKAQPKSGKRSRSDSDEEATHHFEIELAGYVHSPAMKRGIGDKVKAFAKKAKAHIIKIKESANVANLTIKRLERKVEQGLVMMNVPGGETDFESWETIQSLQEVELLGDRAPKVLLFVHGTFSSTAGSYGGLCETPEGEAFLKKAFEAYDLVLGFDHHTLSETPAENAWELEGFARRREFEDQYMFWLNWFLSELALSDDQFKTLAPNKSFWNALPDNFVDFKELNKISRGNYGSDFED